MVKIARDVILNKEGIEDIMSVDLNDSKNYNVEEETFIVEARVVYALLDMGMKPNIYLDMSNAGEYCEFIRTRKDNNSRFAITEMYTDVRAGNKIVAKVCEVLPKFIYLKPKCINDLGNYLINPSDVVVISSTPAEFKRMLLIFDELKYKRNTHHILEFEIPEEGNRWDELNNKVFSARRVIVPSDVFKDGNTSK